MVIRLSVWRDPPYPGTRPCCRFLLLLGAVVVCLVFQQLLRPVLQPSVKGHYRARNPPHAPRLDLQPFFPKQCLCPTQELLKTLEHLGWLANY